jgi:AcrR family transcriptional regulator
MARRSDHSREELKELILQTAWKVVGKQGFDGLTARKLATEIGYAPGTIYNLFKSMDEIYLQVNSRTMDMLYETLVSEECNNTDKTPIQNIRMMAELYMKFAHKYRPYWLMLFFHKLPEGRKAQKWYLKKIERLFEPLEELLSPFFKPQQAKKRKMAARVLWTSIHGLCFLQETGKISLVDKKSPAEDMASYLINNFVAGLKS